MDAIRNVQRSSIAPTGRRTEAEIQKEIEESRSSYYYETKQEEKKKYGFGRSSELDMLLQRKKKIAEVGIEGAVKGSKWWAR